MVASSANNRDRRAEAGFTLLELLTVIGIISVLMGIGLGYLGKTDPELVAQTILRGEPYHHE